MVRAMRTRPVLLAALAAAALVACGDDGSPPAIDARLPDAQTDAASCVPVDDSNECTTDECVNDLPVNTPRTGASCAAGGTCSSAGVCVPAASCTDNMMNGTETGVDCGGSCAPASTCGTGIGCAIAADCTSGVCSGTPMTCQAARCGDGTMQAGEMCDDGNDTNGDGCDDGAGDACRATGCGNGVVTGTEVCDDGNAMNGDGCDNNCTATACGNGVTAGAETCDDGNATGGDGCSATCAVEAGYTCTTMVPSVCTDHLRRRRPRRRRDLRPGQRQHHRGRRLLGDLHRRDRLRLHRHPVGVRHGLRQRHHDRARDLRRQQHRQPRRLLVDLPHRAHRARAQRGRHAIDGRLRHGRATTSTPRPPRR
jgi:cysteine-rich repeat protein